MVPRNDVMFDVAGPSGAASAATRDSRTVSIGFGGERRGSQNEAWASRNRLHCAALALAGRAGAVNSTAPVPSGYRMVCSCDLETLDEAH